MRMIMTRLLIGTSFFCFSQSVYAADLVASSMITDVIVYPARATITRTAEVDLPAGASTIILENMPQGLLPDSLRVQGSALQPVKLGALENKIVTQTEVAAPREKEISEKITALTDQRELLVADVNTLNSKKEFLETIGKQAALRTQDNITMLDLKPEQWSLAADTLAKSMSEVLYGIANKQVEIRHVDQQITALQDELGRLSTGAQSTYRLALPVESNVPTKLTLSLSYQMMGATWRPVYDARLNTKDSSIKVTQYGSVSQRTGEDWTNVHITLSTAQPAQGATLPVLSPLWVNLYEPYRQEMKLSRFKNEIAMSASAPEMSALSDASESAIVSQPVPQEHVMATTQEVKINTGGFVSEYAVTGTSTVLADGSESKVMLGDRNVASDLKIKVFPQITNMAFVVATATLEGDAPLLPGVVSLFRDGAFLGSSNLNMVRSGEKFDLGFGADDQVTVTQKTMQDEMGEAGNIISKQTTRTRLTLAEIQNLHKNPIKLVVDQMIPTTNSEEIAVTINKEGTRAGFDQDADKIKGLLRWKMDLAPQQKEEFGLSTTISWPKGKSVMGLPY